MVENEMFVEVKDVKDFTDKEKLFAKGLLALLSSTPIVPMVGVALMVPGFSGDKDWACGKAGNVIVWGEMSEEAVTVLLSFLGNGIISPYVMPEDVALEVCRVSGMVSKYPIVGSLEELHRIDQEANSNESFWVPIALKLERVPPGFGVSLH